MQDLDPAIRRYKIWNQHLEKVCHGIGENELHYRSMPESNSAAWILAHLIDNYREFVQLCGREESKKHLEGLGVPDEREIAEWPFSRIFSLLNEYRRLFLDETERLDRAGRLNQVIPAGEGKTWLDLFHTVIHNEIYHCGQLAYIARILQQKAHKNNK